MNPKKANTKIAKVEEPSVVYESSNIKFKGIDRATFDFEKEFKNDLIEVLNKHSTKESFTDINTLQVRIENINQITNLESLKKPFSILGITLLDEDLKVIKSRNDFLHGRVPDFKKQGANRSIELKDYDLYYASVRLYTLLNVLIFKMIGFDNYVLNFPKIYEKNTKFKVKENYYRKV